MCNHRLSVCTNIVRTWCVTTGCQCVLTSAGADGFRDKGESQA